MSKATPKALSAINSAIQEKRTSLFLGNCGLDEVPIEILELPWIEELTFSQFRDWEISNNILELPSWLSELKNIRRINLTDCDIKLIDVPGLVVDYETLQRQESSISADNIVGLKIRNLSHLKTVCEKYKNIKELTSVAL